MPKVCRVALLLLAAACGEPAEDPATRPLPADGGVLHPQAQYLPFADAERHAATLNDSASSGELLKPLELLPPGGIAVGGDSTAPFGEVRYVIGVGADLGVFDPYQLGLHMVSREGRVLATLGRQGSGPGEFRRPTAAYAVAPDTVLIADIWRKIELFVQHEGEWEHLRTASLDFSLNAICRLDGRWYAFGSAGPGEGPVRELDGSFNVTRRFGARYASPNEGINNALSEYALLCDATSRTLVLAPRAGIGELYLLSPDGELRHALRWRDFRPILIREDSTGFGVSGGEGGFNRLRTLGTLRPGVMLAQYDYVSSDDFNAKEMFTTLFSVAIDLATGQVIGSSIALPPLSIVDAGMVVTHVLDPWPGIVIHDGADGGH